MGVCCDKGSKAGFLDASRDWGRKGWMTKEMTKGIFENTTVMCMPASGLDVIQDVHNGTSIILVSHIKKDPPSFVRG